MDSVSSVRHHSVSHFFTAASEDAIVNKAIHAVLLVSALWPNSSSVAVVDQTAQQAVSKIRTLAQTKRLLRDFQYLNYAAPYQTPIPSYGDANVGFLRSVSQKYDPKKTFQNRASGGFKIPQ